MLFAIGAQPFMVYPYTPGRSCPRRWSSSTSVPIPPSSARIFPTRLGLVGDPKATLAALLPLVSRPGRRFGGRRGSGRRPGHAGSREIDQLEEARADPLQLVADGSDGRRPTPSSAAYLPNTVVVDEAITTGFYVRGFHHWTEPGRYFFCKGGGLGWGMPAALGVSLGLGRDPVLCVVGDGSAMYSPQALWTAAHEQLPVVFAVVNNRQYLILKGYLRGMAARRARRPTDSSRWTSTTRRSTTSGLARSMGVDTTLVEKAGDVGDAVGAALASGRPHLLELPIAAP